MITIIMILSTTYLSEYEDVFVSKKQTALNSSVEVRHSSEMGRSKRGSGLIVSIGDLNYVLTNAHVCLVDNTSIYHVSNSQKINYNISNNHVSMFLSVEGKKELIYDLKMDVCLIPIKDIKPVYSYSLLDAKMMPPEQSISYDWDSHFNLFQSFYSLLPDFYYEAYTITSNHTRKDNAVYVGTFLRREVNQYFVATSSENLRVQLLHPEGYAFDFAAKPGDSGSPVFDSGYNLIGVLFASRSLLHENNVFEYKEGSVVSISHVLELVYEEISKYYKNKDLAIKKEIAFN